MFVIRLCDWGRRKPTTSKPLRGMLRIVIFGQRAMEIKEHLGNLAGMASSYHNLGTLAQDRGDYDEAERRYRQTLEISERLCLPSEARTNRRSNGT